MNGAIPFHCTPGMVQQLNSILVTLTMKKIPFLPYKHYDRFCTNSVPTLQPYNHRNKRYRWFHLLRSLPSTQLHALCSLRCFSNLVLQVLTKNLDLLWASQLLSLQQLLSGSALVGEFLCVSEQSSQDVQRCYEQCSYYCGMTDTFGQICRGNKQSHCDKMTVPRWMCPLSFFTYPPFFLPLINSPVIFLRWGLPLAGVCLFVVMSLLRTIQCCRDINNTLFTDKQIRSSLGPSLLVLS